MNELRFPGSTSVCGALNGPSLQRKFTLERMEKSAAMVRADRSNGPALSDRIEAKSDRAIIDDVLARIKQTGVLLQDKADLCFLLIWDDQFQFCCNRISFSALKDIAGLIWDARSHPVQLCAFYMSLDLLSFGRAQQQSHYMKHLQSHLTVLHLGGSLTGSMCSIYFATDSNLQQSSQAKHEIPA